MTAPALPPFARLLGLTAEPQDDGSPLLVMPFADPVLGRPGFLHGGAIAGLLEMAAIAALRHALGAADATRIKPVNVTMEFLRGGRDHPTRAAGSIVRIGGRVANIAATAWQEDRTRPIAAARITCLLVRA